MSTRAATAMVTSEDLRTEALRALQVDPTLVARQEERYLVRELLGCAAGVVVGETPPRIVDEYRLSEETLVLMRAVTTALKTLAVTPPAWASTGTLAQRAAIFAAVALIERACGLDRRPRE